MLRPLSRSIFVLTMSLPGLSAQTPWFSLSDHSPRFGSLRPAGDVNGDGADDLIVLTRSGGDPWLEGRILIISGSDGRTLLHVGKETPFHGPAIDNLAGMQAAGDIDGDGHADLFANRNEVLSGADFSVLRRFPVLAGGGYFVRPLGDVDGDGWGDLHVEKRYLDYLPSPNVFHLEVMVLSTRCGDISNAWRVDTTGWDATVTTFVGDVDGDGHPDVALSFWQLGGPASRLEIRSGATGRLVVEKDFVFYQNGGLIGVRPASDLDGDGLEDLLMVVQPPDYELWTRVVSGHDLSVIHDLVTPTAPFYYAPEMIAEISDLTGDDVRDILVGVKPTNENGYVALFCGATGQLAWTTSGPTPELGFGRSLVDLGDVTGDGVPDFAVQQNESSVLEPGSVHVISGASLPIVNLAGGTPVTTPVSQSSLDPTVAPVLTARGTLRPGDPLDVRLANGPPGRVGYLVAGTSLVTSPPPHLPWLVPVPELVRTERFDAEGVASWSESWPHGSPPGLPVFLQGWVLDHQGEPAPWRASNALSLTGR